MNANEFQKLFSKNPNTFALHIRSSFALGNRNVLFLNKGMSKSIKLDAFIIVKVLMYFLYVKASILYKQFFFSKCTLQHFNFRKILWQTNRGKQRLTHFGHKRHFWHSFCIVQFECPFF